MDKFVMRPKSLSGAAAKTALGNASGALQDKRSKSSKRAAKELGLSQFILSKLLSGVPLTLLLLILVFLWSSTTTIISGHIVHVCVSSRKLYSLYCLSSGAQPNFDIPLPLINASSVDDHKLEVSIRESVPSVDIKNNATLVTQEIASYVVQENNIDDHKLKVSIRENGSVDINDDKALVTQDIPEFESTVKVVEEHLQVHRSWRSNSSSLTTCDGRGVYVYDLPPKFNKDLVAHCSDMSPWLDFCQFFRNEALGEPIPKLGKAWYNTHQYSLEPIFHSRVMKHPCRVYNGNEAKLFYVPFYGGLDILRWHFKNASPDVKETLALELVEWLKLQKPWALNSGKDHVFVLGKVSWDFRRRDDSPWGSTFLNLEEMQNLIKLLIERQPWHVNDIGIPHPTYFHPHSDEDIISWQFKIIQSSRNNLVSFAGGARPDSPDSIRSVLFNQCTLASTGTCKFQNCSSGGCDQPESIIELFLESEFCLQPPGDSPTRKSVFDSLISGCIPVFFDPFTAYYQYSWHLPEDHGKYSIFIDQEEVRKSKVNVVEWLMKIPKKARDDMRRYIVYELLPGLVYGDSSSDFEQFQDAFSITMNNLLEKVTILE
ncbi:xyloglucan-specific galacturonosyltransferase 1-like [Apium graveolens]|uniref:xyloglucan-specific galacturonosyltransferase 1-like n=1 Tax=Apium graveolens TaxID=4045 RepID=UPI003D7A27BD